MKKQGNIKKNPLHKPRTAMIRVWVMVLIGFFLLASVGTLIILKNKSQEVLVYDYVREVIGTRSLYSLEYHETEIGYDIYGDTVEIWNTEDTYYFDINSGIQFTNHYEDFWSHNIFCIGYYDEGEWIKIKCADELPAFERDIYSDFLTYVNATLWNDFSYGDYDLRLGIQYHLGLNDKSLSVTIYGKNIGIDIPYDLGFAWKVKDIEIPPNSEGDSIRINDTKYFLDGNYDLSFKDMKRTTSVYNNETEEYEYTYEELPYFVVRDKQEFLRLDWNENLNYAVKMYGNGNQEDFYVAILINAGHFNPQQEKQTTFYWIDAEGDYVGTWDYAGSCASNTVGFGCEGDYCWAFQGVGQVICKFFAVNGTFVETWAATANVAGYGLDVHSDFLYSADTDGTVYVYYEDNHSNATSWDVSADCGTPTDIAVEGTNVYVIDAADDSICHFFTNQSFGYNISINPPVTTPTGIACSDEFCWVADSSNEYVYKFYINGSGTGFNFSVAEVPDTQRMGLSTDYLAVNVWDEDVYLYETPTDALPTIVLNSPVDAFNTTTPTIDFNCTVGDDNGITNVSLLINGTVEQTNTSGLNGTDYIFTETIITGAGLYNWTCQAFDDGDQLNASLTRDFNYINELMVSLVSPVNAYNSTSSSITFNGTANDDTAVINVSLYIDGVLNETNSSGLNATYYLFTKSLDDGDHNWTYETCDTISCVFATTRDLFVDVTSPVINITYPTIINYHVINTNLSLNWTVSDSNLDSCWYDYNGSLMNVTCLDNHTGINITDPSNTNVTFYVNDTFGNDNSDYQEWDILIFERSTTYNSTSYETERETFYMNITTNGTTPTDVQLIYDGTSYSTTPTNTHENNYDVLRTIDIPVTAEAKTFFFNFTVSGTETSSSTLTQTIDWANFTECPDDTPFINISFKNETIAEEDVNATIASSWNYWLGEGTVFKTLSFSNATENRNYQFCLDSLNRTTETNISMTYTNSISQQRNFAGDFSLTNDTTSQILFLLPTTEGVYVTFQVVNAAEQPIPGVTSNVTMAGTLIASGTTDDAGTISYFLDPDTSYTFTFFREDYDIFITTLTPTQTTFTIVLGAEAVAEEDDYTRGITYSISPGAVSLVNHTNTYFNFTLTSAYWTVEEFGFNLTSQNRTLLNETSAVTNGGTIFVFHNTSNDTTITMTFFWTIAGNVSTGSTFWTVFDSSGTGWGLTTFFSHLTAYLDTEMFGLNTNSMIILVYIIIFITTGIMSFKYGIRSPAAISVMIFGFVFLFEVHLKWIPSIAGSNFPVLTIIFALMSLVLILREGLK